MKHRTSAFEQILAVLILAIILAGMIAINKSGEDLFQRFQEWDHKETLRRVA